MTVETSQCDGKKKPWLKFFPNDWLSDPTLRICTPAARGLWIDCVALMHQADPYGYLLINGTPPSERQLAVLTAMTIDEVQTLLAELETAGVYSRTEDGIIYSRRMVRDHRISEKNRTNGALGGNPKLKGKRKSKPKAPKKADNCSDKPADNPPLNPPDNQQSDDEVLQAYHQRMQGQNESENDERLTPENEPGNPPAETAETLDEQDIDEAAEGEMLPPDNAPDKGAVNPPDNLTHAHVPEARSQRPYSSDPDSIDQNPEARSSAAHAREGLNPVEIIRVFDEVLVQVFGPENGRPWPTQRDMEYARHFLECGADLELCRQLFEERQHGRKQDHQRPIESLSYFKNIVPEAVQARESIRNQSKEVYHHETGSSTAVGRPAGQAGRSKTAHDNFTQGAANFLRKRRSD